MSQNDSIAGRTEFLKAIYFIPVSFRFSFVSFWKPEVGSFPLNNWKYRDYLPFHGQNIMDLRRIGQMIHGEENVSETLRFSLSLTLIDYLSYEKAETLVKHLFDNNIELPLWLLGRDYFCNQGI